MQALIISSRRALRFQAYAKQNKNCSSTSEPRWKTRIARPREKISTLDDEPEALTVTQLMLVHYQAEVLTASTAAQHFIGSRFCHTIGSIPPC
jgi:hypothetical protein